MKNDKNHVELFSEDACITLFDDKENPIEFFEVAGVEYEERFYELLQPCDKVEGIEDDEAVIFECITDEESGEKLFKPVQDEKICDAVFGLYLLAAADMEATDCGGGCAGGNCGDGRVCPKEEATPVAPTAKPKAEPKPKAASAGAKKTTSKKK